MSQRCSRTRKPLADQLRIRLDTFHADISAAMEDAQPGPACPANVTPITGNKL